MLQTSLPSDDAAQVIARRIIVSGRVQGVFYRNWTEDTARRLGLTGWVRNRRTGEVEILAQGLADDVEELERECWKGPFGAAVQDVKIEKAHTEPLRSFERRPTI